MQETRKQQHIPVKVYRTDERLMVAAPMAGLEPEDIVVDVTADGRLVLHGNLRGLLKEVKELLLLLEEEADPEQEAFLSRSSSSGNEATQARSRAG